MPSHPVKPGFTVAQARSYLKGEFLDYEQKVIISRDNMESWA